MARSPLGWAYGGNLESVSADLTLEEYRELAELRYQIRRFESAMEEDARRLGIEPASWLLLLTVQGLPEGVKPTISALADRMRMDGQVVSELVDAAVAQNHLVRSSADAEGAEHWVKLTRQGRDLLRRVALNNRSEREDRGAELAGALQSLLKQRRRRVA